MLNKIKSIILKENTPEFKVTRTSYLEHFFGRSEHNWIVKDKYIADKFYELFSLLSLEQIKFMYKSNVCFVRSSGKYSCALSQNDMTVVIVFPQLYRLLKSTAGQFSLAILAHELGHIFCGHSQVIIDPLEAQVEADRFACELGFTGELISFMEDQPESIEKRVRLSYLTMNLMKDLKDI